MLYDVLKCEEVLIDEGYVVIRPEEKLYIVKKFGKNWALITDDDKETVRGVLNEVKNEDELRRLFYCVEVDVIE